MVDNVQDQTMPYDTFLRNPIVKKPGVTDAIEAPKNVITNVNAAKNLYFQNRIEHLPRISVAAAIEGLIAGNPPYNPGDLAAAKLDHISNFNNLDARSLYERYALTYWNLLNESSVIAKFEVKDLDGTSDELRYSEILSRNFDTVIRSWPSFNVVFNTLTGQLSKLGISPIIWPDEKDWRFRVVEYNRFFVPDQTQSDIEFLTYVCVETVFTAQDLFHIYDNIKDKDPSETPWKKDVLAKFLLQIANTFAKNTQWGDGYFLDVMDVQRHIQNHDLTYNAIFTDSIRLVSLLYQEYDKKISHMMFHPWYVTDDFLFYADRQYKCMDEGIMIFTASPGEITIHSNIGLGHKIFAGSQAIMQLDCSIIDMAKMSGTPLIKTLPTTGKDFEKIRFYPGVPTNIGTTEVVENTLGENISQLIGAAQYIMQKLEFNSANSGDNPAYPDKNIGSISDSQARRQDFKEFGILKNYIAHFYSQWDKVLQNVVVKMLNSEDGCPGYEYAKEWKDMCLAEGVPESIFSIKNTNIFGMPRHLSVKATRVAGSGSDLARIMGLEGLGPMVSTFGPKGFREYQREMIIALMGRDYVEPFLQDAGDPDESAGGASLAAVENGIMQIGNGSVVVSPDNEQKAHFVTHLALANNTIRTLQQQQSTPVEADKIFSVLIPHMEEHWQLIIKNPYFEPFAAKMKPIWTQVEQYARLNRKNAEEQLKAQLRKQQEQEQQTQQVLSDEQLKNIKVMGDEKRKNFAMQKKEERADKANETRAEIMRDKTIKDSENQRLKINLEAGNRSAETQSKIANENAKNASELRKDLLDMAGKTPSPSDFG